MKGFVTGNYSVIWNGGNVYLYIIENVENVPSLKFLASDRMTETEFDMWNEYDDITKFRGIQDDLYDLGLWKQYAKNNPITDWFKL